MGATLIILAFYILFLCLPSNKKKEQEQMNRRYEEQERRERIQKQHEEESKNRILTQQVMRRGRHRAAAVKQTVVKSSPVVAPLEWFITDWGMKSVPSPAEQRIIDELNKYPVKWHREVSFSGFMSPNKGYYRYDFYIPSMRLCIEYDSVMWHNSEQAAIDDRIKTEFCAKNNLRLIRYNRKDYYHMEDRIKKLLGK